MQTTIQKNKEKETIPASGDQQGVLVRSLTENIKVDAKTAQYMLKSADKTVYSVRNIPTLKSDQTWINGGQTREWHDISHITGKPTFALESAHQ